MTGSRLPAHVLRRIELLERATEVAGIGTWDWNLETDKAHWSDNVFRMFGLQPGDAEPSPRLVVEYTYEDDRERVRLEFEAAAATGEMSELEYPIVRADGTVRHLLVIVQSVEQADDRTRMLAGTVQDITERRRAENEVAAQIALGEVLADWTSFDADAPRLLTCVGDAQDLDTGVLWLVRGDLLEVAATWSTRSSGPFPLALTPHHVRDGPGQALPVEAVRSGRPVVLADLDAAPSFTGRDAARRAGFASALAIPAADESGSYAVLEFHCRRRLQPSETLPRTLAAMGHELGHFLAHRRGELWPGELTPREREVLQLTAQGLSGKMVAQELALSPSTVKTHFENIYAKWGVSDRASAVAKAFRDGLIR